MELTLYTNPRSRGRIARWMLEETGADYRTVVLDYETGMKSADFLAINPMGKVPTLTHGDIVVTEAAAICAYLADALPGAGLAPSPGDPARGPYYRWLFFAAGPLEQAVTNRAIGVPEEGRGRMLGYGSYATTLDALSGLLCARDYVTGRFSAADVYVGAAVAWGLRFGSVEPRPGFEAYAARVSERPAYLRAAAADDALMEAAGAAG